MRCPDCGKLIGYFIADNPPRCPLTGRLIDLAAPRRRSPELARRPAGADDGATHRPARENQSASKLGRRKLALWVGGRPTPPSRSGR